MSAIDSERLRENVVKNVETMLEKLRPHSGFEWTIKDDNSTSFVRVNVVEIFPSKREDEDERVITYQISFPVCEPLTDEEIRKIFHEATNWLSGLPNRSYLEMIDCNALRGWDLKSSDLK